MPIMSRQWLGVRRGEYMWSHWDGYQRQAKQYDLDKDHRKRLEAAGEDVRNRMKFDTIQAAGGPGFFPGSWQVSAMGNRAHAVRNALGVHLDTGPSRTGFPSRNARHIPRVAWQFGETFLWHVALIEDLISQQVPSKIRTEIDQAFQPMRDRADALKAVLATVMPRPAGQWGYLELPQFAAYDYYTKVGLYFPSATKRFIWEMNALSRVATPWIAGRRSVFLQARPRVRFDDAGRIHSETGPAIDFGFEGGQFYAWRGLIVPKSWFTGGLTAKRALSYRNAEKRRAACDKLGWHKVLDDLGAVIVNESGNPQIGTLVQVIINEQIEQFLKVQCGTGRQFAIPVPRDMDSAIRANAWTYGIETPWAFKVPEVRS